MGHLGQRRRWPARGATAALCCLLGAPVARAQDPPPPPQQQQPRPPQPKPPDEPDRAADVLRRLLGLRKGPGGNTGTVPEQPPTPPPVIPTPAQEPELPPAAVQPGPPLLPQPLDPAEAAARALRRLLPGAERPTVAPLPQVPPLLARPEPGSMPQDPSKPSPADDTGRAAGALERLLPTATPPRDPPAMAQPTTGPQTPAPRRVPGVPVHGSLSLRYRGRTAARERDRDQDLVGLLSLTVGDPQRHAVTGHFLGRGYADLDGRQRDNALNGLDQALHEPLNGRVYTAHLDFHRLPHLDLARAGRQILDETPATVEFDGLRVETGRFGPERLWFGAHGGVPVHHFEASRGGDAVFGLSAGAQPWDGGRLRADWLHLRDDFLGFGLRDDLLGLGWWQDLTPALQLRGRHTWLEGDPRDLLVRGRAEVEPWGLSLDFGYRELLTTQRLQVTELDPFYLIAFAEAPYRQVDATATLAISDHLDVTAGADLRRLRDAADEGPFNREFERLHLGPAVHGLCDDRLSASLTAEYWNSQGEDFRTIGGEVRWRFSPRTTGSFGTDYHLFRFDSLQDRERDHVRDWHLRLEHRADHGLRLDGGYHYERDSTDEYHLFRLGMTWTF